jgi:hypothetical protein
MLYKRKDDAPNLCVLRVSVAVLEGEGTVITDCNAASDYVRFLAPEQWSVLDFDDIYAADWRHPGNPPRYYQHRSRKCAEVLVPQCVEPNLLDGACVADEAARTRLTQLGFALPVAIDPVLFFR